MAYKILPTKEFSKDFRMLDQVMRKRVRRKVEAVALDPTRCKRLHYDLRESCRLRIGTLRILFSYDEGKQELYLEKVIAGHKYKA